MCVCICLRIMDMNFTQWCKMCKLLESQTRWHHFDPSAEVPRCLCGTSQQVPFLRLVPQIPSALLKIAEVHD